MANSNQTPFLVFWWYHQHWSIMNELIYNQRPWVHKIILPTIWRQNMRYGYVNVHKANTWTCHVRGQLEESRQGLKKLKALMRSSACTLKWNRRMTDFGESSMTRIMSTTVFFKRLLLKKESVCLCCDYQENNRDNCQVLKAVKAAS